MNPFDRLKLQQLLRQSKSNEGQFALADHAARIGGVPLLLAFSYAAGPYRGVPVTLETIERVVAILDELAVRDAAGVACCLLETPTSGGRAIDLIPRLALKSSNRVLVELLLPKVFEERLPLLDSQGMYCRLGPHFPDGVDWYAVYDRAQLLDAALDSWVRFGGHRWYPSPERVLECCVWTPYASGIYYQNALDQLMGLAQCRCFPTEWSGNEISSFCRTAAATLRDLIVTGGSDGRHPAARGWDNLTQTTIALLDKTAGPADVGKRPMDFE